MSKIEWTSRTWNPVTGCTKVSPGCKHCYAERMAIRLKNMGQEAYKDGFKMTMHLDRLTDPLKREKPTMYFVCSMSDLFHEDIPFHYIGYIMETIRQTPHHTYQILTKRAKKMRAYFEINDVPDNAWIGVSVEDIKYGLPRVDELRAIDASVRFLSCEPLLEDIADDLNLAGIHWVIVGGESGPGARPMNKEWAVNLLDKCVIRNAQSKFFFKQWGAYGEDGVRRSKKANGRRLLGALWDGMPSVG